MQNITFFQRITVYLILYPWIKYIITFIFLILLRMLFVNQVFADEISSKSEINHETTKKYIKIGLTVVACVFLLRFAVYHSPIESTDISVINYDIANITVELPKFIPLMCLDYVTDIYAIIKNSVWLKNNMLTKEATFSQGVFYELFITDRFYSRLTILLKATDVNDPQNAFIRIIQVFRACQTATHSLLDKQIFFSLGFVHTFILENIESASDLSPIFRDMMANSEKYNALINHYKQIGAQLLISRK